MSGATGVARRASLGELIIAAETTPRLGDLLPAPDRAQPFQIAPAQPGDWHYDPAAWVQDGPQYRPWDERWDTFLDEVVAPVVAPIATALPLAIPYAAHMLTGAGEAAWAAATAPHRAMGGEYPGLPSGNEMNLPEEGLNLAGALSLGPLATRAAPLPGRASVASRAENLYDPSVVAPRPFEADYPNGAAADGTGRILFDIEGRPINPQATIVGRGVLGGPDAAVADGAIDGLGAQVIGRNLAYPPRSQIVSDSAVGEFGPEFDAAGNFTGRGVIGVAGDSPPDQLPLLAAHEVSHAMDHRGAPAASVDDFNNRRWGANPPDPNMDIETELHTIYRDMNNARGSRIAINGPADLGYPARDVPRELWAEAIRAYMADPNYIKTVAPNVARAIRDHVNTHPELSRIIHFNAGGVPIPVAPIPDTLQDVRLPGGEAVAPLSDLLGQVMLANAPSPPRPPLGPQWAVDRMAAYGDPNSPQYAARVAQEQADYEAREAEVRRLADEQAIRDGRIVIY